LGQNAENLVKPLLLICSDRKEFKLKGLSNLFLLDKGMSYFIN